MCGIAILRWITTAGVLTAVASTGYGANDTPVGLIVSISGSVSLERGEPPAHVDLNGAEGLAWLLYPGDTLTCQNGAKATVHLDSVIFPKKQDLSCSAGRPIPIPRAPGSYISGPQDPLGALQGYARAGRAKGNDLAIFSPAENGAVAIDRFALGWTTKPDIGTFVLVLLDPQGRELARTGRLKGTDGSADGEPFRRAIADYLARNAAAGNFKLVFRLDEGGEQISNFSVLTKEQENQVSAELAGVDRASPLFAHLQRAAILDSHQLYNDEAAEYELAIGDAPNSVTLLRAATNVCSRIGDLRRAQEYSVRARQAEAQ